MNLLLLLAFTGGFFGALLGCLGLALRFSFRRLGRSSLAFRLCLLRLAGRKVGRFVALAIKSYFGDPYGSKRLAMSVNLLVLLFALEVEDQDLIGLATFHYLSADYGTGTGTNGAFLAGDSQNVIEFNNVAICGG